ncbi:MAG: threonylcarbamoyl-AMP synthase [Chloroflexi bacterium]|nr:threonylcarbamoyl-AMP synthase [Chloroflexota bacterium]
MSRILSAEFPEAAQMAADVLWRAELVVLPTDTVYGVGSIIDEAAIDRLFAAKKRSPERAIPVLLSGEHAVGQVASDFPEPARRLAAAFWPGPLTLALPKRDDLPKNLSGLTTVGVRVPGLDHTRAIIAAAGGALAVSSANRSDQPPACTIQAAIRYLSDTVALYLDGGTCVGGVPSTVVSFENGELVIVRPGPISEAALRAALANEG